MNLTFRSITPADRKEYLALCREFYHSPAVLHSVPENHDAARLYGRMGFAPLDYRQMVLDFP